MNVELGSMGIPKVMSAVKGDDGKIEVHANVESWWVNHDKDNGAEVGKVPVHFTNPTHFQGIDVEAWIQPPLLISPGARGSTAQSGPLLVVMSFNAPPNLDQPISGELLKQEGLEIQIRQEPKAQATWD